MAEYALLGMLAANALVAVRPEASRWDLGQGALALTALWGWIDELHQFGVPGRSTDPFDLAADVLGAALGIWFFLSRRTPVRDIQAMDGVR